MQIGQSAVLWLCFAGHLAAQESPPPEVAAWLAPQRWQRDADGPIVSLGKAGEFDDQHVFAPAVLKDDGKYSLWYSGSQGSPGNRVFRLGLATGTDGKHFAKHPRNPVLGFADGKRSVLTPTLLRNGDGSAVRENGKLRMWHSAAALGKSGLHTLHETASQDGVAWSESSPPLMENVYSPSVLKTEAGYEMWYSDVARRPWLIRHAMSSDGTKWQVDPGAALQLSQRWETEILVYPTVLKVDGVYLMWYGSYDNSIRRELTAIGFAVSKDGKKWWKHPQNPVIKPEPSHDWESNYVGNGCAMRLPDGSFRYWYASRKAPPFLNLYYAIGTVHWDGPTKLLTLPPRDGESGMLTTIDKSQRRSVTILEIVDEDEAIARLWYAADKVASADGESQLSFIDVWLRGVDTKGLAPEANPEFSGVFRVKGTKSIDTTCGKRNFIVLEGGT